MNMQVKHVPGFWDRFRQPPASCPFCGTDPGLARQVNGVFLVGCEESGCPANPQVAADTVADAWTKWNRRVLA